MASPEQRVGPGWESQFATNHLGHFTLLNTLWPALAAAGSARVVSLSSTGHKLSPIRFEDINFENGYDKWKAYGQAKTANALFAVELDRLGRSSGVRAFAVHPGGIMTELQRYLPREEMVAAGWMDDAGNVREGFKTPEQGAATSTWAATSPALAGMGGVYCEDCDIAKPTDPASPLARYQGVDAHAVDPEAATKAVGRVCRNDGRQRVRLGAGDRVELGAFSLLEDAGWVVHRALGCRVQRQPAAPPGCRTRPRGLPRNRLAGRWRRVRVRGPWGCGAIA